MGEIKEGDLLWQPSDKEIEEANLTHYLAWLRAAKGLDFAGYAELWHWSVTELEDFWASLWDYFAVVASAPYTAVLGAGFPAPASTTPRISFATRVRDSRPSGINPRLRRCRR
jgi:acetoacetyl-CoA synthetase